MLHELLMKKQFSQNELFSFYNNKKIMITGHTGFKGAWLCRMLINAGAIVTGYSLKPPTEPNLFSMADIENKMISKIPQIKPDTNVIEYLFLKSFNSGFFNKNKHEININM